MLLYTLWRHPFINIYQCCIIMLVNVVNSRSLWEWIWVMLRLRPERQLDNLHRAGHIYRVQHFMEKKETGCLSLNYTAEITFRIWLLLLIYTNFWSSLIRNVLITCSPVIKQLQKCIVDCTWIIVVTTRCNPLIYSLPYTFFSLPFIMKKKELLVCKNMCSRKFQKCNNWS